MNSLIWAMLFTMSTYTCTSTLTQEKFDQRTSSVVYSEPQINDIVSVIAHISKALNPSLIDFCGKDFSSSKKILKKYQDNYLSIADCQKDAISPSRTLNLDIYKKSQELRSECLFCHIKVWNVQNSDIDESRNFAHQEYWNSQGTYFYILFMSKFSQQKPLVGKPRTSYWIEAIYNEGKNYFKIYEVYSLSSSSEPLVQYAAQWNLDKGFVLDKNWPIGFGPRDFQGKSIHTAALDQTAPFVSKVHLCSETSGYHVCIKVRPKFQIRPENTTGYFSGFLIKIFDDLAEKYNFTYIIDNYGEEHYELKTENGYKGLTSLIWNRKVDLLVQSIFMADYRFDYMGFTHLVEYTYNAMFYDYKAVKFAGRWEIYTGSFNYNIWLTIPVSIFVYSLVHWLMKKYDPRNKRLEIVAEPRNTENTQDENYRNMSDIFMTYFSCIVQQGLSDTPSAIYLRILFWIFWAMSVTLYASYSGFLISYLTLETQVPEFETLEEVIEANEWNVGTSKGTIIPTQLAYSKKPWHQKLYRDLTQNPDLLADSYQDAYHRTQTQKYVHYDDVVPMSFLYANCTTRKIPDKDFRNYGYFAKQKYLPYSRILDQTLLKIFTSGIHEYHEGRLLGGQQFCEKLSAYNEIEIYHIFPACIVFISGLVLSVLFLISERAVNRWMSRIAGNFIVTD